MHPTVLEIRETDTGFEATQEGSSVIGTGEIPSRAAEDYCRQVAEQRELQEAEERSATEEADA